METKTHTWQANANYLTMLLTILDRNKNLFNGWAANDHFENLSFIFLEKIRVNLLAVNVLLQRVSVMEIHFVPVALILRTIVTDIVVHKYLRRVNTIAGIEGVKQELNVIDLEFVKTMKKIFDILKEEHPTETGSLNAHFMANYTDYLRTDGSRKNAKDVRIDKGVIDKINDYKSANKIIANDTDKEGGKIDFLIDANKRNLKFLYSYLAQFHHYTTKSLLFYKDKDFRLKNIDVARSMIWLSASTFFEIYSDLNISKEVCIELKEFAESMLSEKFD